MSFVTFYVCIDKFHNVLQVINFLNIYSVTNRRLSYNSLTIFTSVSVKPFNNKVYDKVLVFLIKKNVDSSFSIF